MSPTASWVAAAIGALSLGERVRPVDEPGRSDVLRRVAGAFLERPDVLFWWSHLKVPAEKWQTRDGYRHLPQLAPDSRSDCWLITGLEDAEKPVFECTPASASAVLAECPAFEYALVDRALKWMVIENHHEVLIAAGDAAGRLSQLRA